MSEGELNKAGAEEVALMEPPRIPLRIWHWFVWIFSSACLLAVTHSSNMTAAELHPINYVYRVQWMFTAGLVLTALIALFPLLSQKSLPITLRWAPGHILLGLMSLSLSSSLVYLSVSRFSTSSLVHAISPLLLTVVGFLYLTLIAAIVWVGVKLSPGRWPPFFIIWAALFVMDWLSQLLALRGLAPVWLASSTTLGALAALLLLVIAALSDLRREHRPIYSRAWTHWAGVAAYGMSTGIEVVLDLFWHP